MLEVYDGDHLQQDLDLLRADPSAADDADMIDAFLTQIAESEDALWSLMKWSAEVKNPHFNCKAINCFHSNGYNIYRIRPLKGRINKYRILYAYDCQKDDYYLLAVTRKKLGDLPRGTDVRLYYAYESNHPISERVRAEYEKLGLQKIN